MKKSSGATREWTRLGDAALLQVRLCNLNLSLEESPLKERIERLRRDLSRRELAFTPYCWLSTGWFSPDGLPGFALPFFLAHPRLRRLERTQMMHVEGEGLQACMRLLRHETGHAIDSAYRLHRRADWRATFGRYTTPYYADYTPGPPSRDFVQHLDRWYAQSHPAEDFAETFAVWLDPRSDWRKRYAESGALAKLEYVNELMAEIRGRPPDVRGREREDDVRTLRTTLGEYYAGRKKYQAIEVLPGDPRELSRLFGEPLPSRRGTPAERLLDDLTPELLEHVHAWTGEYHYTIYQILQIMIDQARELRLAVARSRREVARDAALLLTVRTMDYVHSPQYKRAR